MAFSPLLPLPLGSTTVPMWMRQSFSKTWVAARGWMSASTPSWGIMKMLSTAGRGNPLGLEGVHQHHGALHPAGSMG